MQQLADHPWLNKNVYIIPQKKPQGAVLEVVKEEVKKQKPKNKTVIAKPVYGSNKPSPNVGKVAPKTFKK